MSQTAAASSLSESTDSVAAPGVWASLVETTKPGITRMVTITSSISFVVAWLSPGFWDRLPIVEFLACAIGTALSAAGANALNMYTEREHDARMARTTDRPIPSGRVRAGTVLLLGLGLAVFGPLVLWAGCSWLPAVVSLVTTASYVLIYTPSKRTTALSTIIGGVPGALPTLIGWTAGGVAAGMTALGSLLTPGAWSLFLILFVWQVPHFLAIAWRYADEYAGAGYVVLPAEDQVSSGGGRTTSLVMLVWTACLLPASLTPLVAVPRVAGPLYATVATLTGLLFLAATVRVIRSRRATHARGVFFASIIHLPLLLLALVVEGTLRHLIPASLW
ncbi:MAG: heme o synthase [Planctomycetota bacterium]